MASNLYSVALQAGVVALSFTGQSAAANVSTPNLRLPVGPSYKYRGVCPAPCYQSGASSGNWSSYHNFAQIASCDEPVWYDFTLVDPVDDADEPHRIYACTNSGNDWALTAANKTDSSPGASANKTTVSYEYGYWPDANGSSVAAGLTTLSFQLQQYLGQGFASSNRTTLAFASAGTTSMGLYIGKNLDSKVIGTSAISYLHNATTSTTFNNTGTLAMQYCEKNLTADNIFGLFVTGNSSFAAVQEALSSWSNATCLSIPETNNFTAPIVFEKPVIRPTNGTSNSTGSANSTSLHGSLERRGDCSTVQVVSGDSCGSLASKCGISGADFTKYNPGKDFCANLKPYQHVCCSAGTLPNFAPKQNSDGSCHTYTIVANDNCANLGAEYSLTNDQIESFNKQTWAWNGCSKLFIGTIMCLSKGTPPMPAELSNAVCGPQKPGTKVPPSGTDISTLNPCPLNACCDVWGQCGITKEFCTNSSTGAPGTAKSGTNGCISNCGTNIVRSSPPSEYRNIAFFEGYNLGRPCLYQDASQIDTSFYSHIFYSFGVLDTNFVVGVGDTESTFEFKRFLTTTGAKKILSIGGWAFSTDPSTYMIFRNAVTAANRQTAANNIASFVKDNGLDGINIDWEYPGAPDIPGIPAASPDDGDNYLQFLKTLRSLLPNSELSVAAPASYWYLKGFPIKEMSAVLDYVIYMTYDLHGQWDANNQWSQEGCPSGSCLRSDVNLTETIGSLVMITKAGVPSNKVIVGVTSYGRSFAMSEANCFGPQCTYLGSAGASQATPGECTNTAGYISNAEINAIVANSSRVNQHFVDDTSHSNILVYDNTQWVGYMDDDVKASRTNTYKGLAMGGVTDWASDLQKYNDPPVRSKSWTMFLARVKAGQDPSDIGGRNGNWTKISCDSPDITDERHHTSQQRWTDLDCVGAWSDGLNAWKYDQSHDHYSFCQSMADTYNVPSGECGDIGTNQCNPQRCNQDDGSGPAGVEIWNSFSYINSMYTQYWNALNGAASSPLSESLASFETTFAPVAPPKETPLWEEILIAIVTLGASLIAAPFFNSVFKTLPAFVGNGNTLGVFKDTTSALITFGSNIAKDTVTPGHQDSWTPEDQNDFSAYLGQAIEGWKATTSNTLKRMFNGDDDSIKILSTLIQNGNFMPGSGGPVDVGSKASSETIDDLSNAILKAFYAFAIPSVWTAAGYAPFILTNNEACDYIAPPDDCGPSSGCSGSTDPIYNYLTTEGAIINACDESTNTLYYLVYPPDDGDKFDALHGSDYLKGGLAEHESDTGTWGGVTREDIILGALNTYRQNGNQNGGQVADPGNSGTLTDLENMDIRTPGYVRLPVCSAATAQAAWKNPSRVDKTDPNYPCVPLQGITDCDSYRYTKATSDASPLITDCQNIINNIQGTDGEWTTTLSRTRQLVSAGTCAFSVEEDTGDDNGNGSYKVGAQDIVTIISNAIKMYGDGTRVGASGTFECNGNIKKQPHLKWYLYHT